MALLLSPAPARAGPCSTSTSSSDSGISWGIALITQPSTAVRTHSALRSNVYLCRCDNENRKTALLLFPPLRCCRADKLRHRDSNKQCKYWSINPQLMGWMLSLSAEVETLLFQISKVNDFQFLFKFSKGLSDSSAHAHDKCLPCGLKCLTLHVCSEKLMLHASSVYWSEICMILFLPRCSGDSAGAGHPSAESLCRCRLPPSHRSCLNTGTLLTLLSCLACDHNWHISCERAQCEQVNTAAERKQQIG